jgi:hypothetical protein
MAWPSEGIRFIPIPRDIFLVFEDWEKWPSALQLDGGRMGRYP